MDDLEHSGLARQVSTLLTNHLARATECSGNEAAGNEALQEVLSLLNNLSRSKMGKAILSQPECVSKLLSLLLDQRSVSFGILREDCTERNLRGVADGHTVVSDRRRSWC